MAIKVAINGFGRIGRNVFRAMFESGQQDQFDVVAVNDLGDADANAHLLQYDTAHGRFPENVSVDGDAFLVGEKRVRVLAERNPVQLPWAELGVDVVMECTGFFTSKEKASAHLTGGAKKVIISAPGGKDVDATIVYGVNHSVLKASDTVISNASCTTNCLAPVAKIVDENWGIQVGSMTTTHAYTADQNIQDAPHSDLRRARAAAFNIVPTSTGAASATGKVYPNVAGKLSAIAVRVPVVTGSMIELNVVLDKPATADEVNAKFKEMADGPLKGILQYSEDPLVSSDIVRNPHSSIFDSLMTEVNGNMLKVVSWYDNEAGYSARLADMAYLVLGL